MILKIFFLFYHEDHEGHEAERLLSPGTAVPTICRETEGLDFSLQIVRQMYTSA